MSILKAILHHYNSTSKSYDTLHPETESAQVTDWHSGIIASLASKTLGTVVDAITTDSVLGKLIKMLLNASGVKYLIDTNGYVCFGSFFGGLIIQWGMNQNTTSRSFIYPIVFSAIPALTCSFAWTTGYVHDETNSGFNYTVDSGNSNNVMRWIAVGY